MIGEQLWDRFKTPKEELFWYYRRATEALRAGGPKPLVEELDRVVKELESLASPQP